MDFPRTAWISKPAPYALVPLTHQFDMIRSVPLGCPAHADGRGRHRYVRRIGKFTVVGELGTGANSTILHISRLEDGRRYALKVVHIESAEDKKFLTQAQHEFRVAQMLDHPNLIKIYAIDKRTDWLFRVTKVQLLIEFVPGHTLDKLTAMSIPKLVPIFVQVAAGLVHMHRRRVFHANMKPNNIIRNATTAQAKRIDYGLACIPP